MYDFDDLERRMIAEIHQAFRPQLIVMDGVDVFVDGGPSKGKLVAAGVIMAGTDRIAIDAVGLAVLKQLGSNDAIMNTKIFEQEQLQRAVERVPGEPEFHNNLGLVLAATDRNDEAIAAYRAALALKPGHVGAWNNLGLALYSTPSTVAGSSVTAEGRIRSSSHTAIPSSPTPNPSTNRASKVWSLP